MAATKKIVIIGGGYGGTGTATALDKALGARSDIEIILITRTETSFHNIGSVRAAVDASFGERLFVPYDNVFTTSKTSRVVHGEVTAISPKTVTLKNAETIAFDYLVIATGSAYPAPFKVPTNTTAAGLELLRKVVEDVKKAKTIVVIGGGPVGCELAGEIAVDYPDKKVIIVQGAKTLMPGPTSPKFKNRLLEGLKERKVEVILDERVSNLDTLFPNPEAKGYLVGPTTLTTSSNRTVEADLVFLTTGNASYNSSVAASLGVNTIDAKSQITVTPTLQLPSHPNIFALGDVSSSTEGMKLSFTASLQAPVVAENIGKLIAAEDPTAVKLKEFSPPGMTVALVTLGKTGGVAQLVMVMGDWFARMMKSKDLMAKRRWNDLGMAKDYKW
ncbi:hypothetical protein HDV00_012184 [Rhizophlyctis rosea]|nr:hypothetical protein HDV00_012184 [Rhizophlyctis rosea]